MAAAQRTAGIDACILSTDDDGPIACEVCQWAAGISSVGCRCCCSHAGALQGLGGDELFGGNPSFHKIPRLLDLHRSLDPARAAAARWLDRSGLHQHLRLATFLRGVSIPMVVALLPQHWGLPAVAFADQVGLESGSGYCYSQADAIAWLESSCYIGQQLLRDSDTYSISIAHGLELRITFVDAQIFR